MMATWDWPAFLNLDPSMPFPLATQGIYLIQCHPFQVFAADPREMFGTQHGVAKCSAAGECKRFDVLLPEGKRADIVIVDPPGTSARLLAHS